MGKMMTKLFAKPLFDSKIKSANTEGKEKVWGYFVGPMFMCMAYYGIAGTYLTQFYTDVLGLSGVVLTMMPVFSKIFDAITNIIMGRIIDKTKTRQGKARPWILISGVLIMLTVLCFTMCQGQAKVYSWYGLSLVTIFSLPLPIPSTICHIR